MRQVAFDPATLAGQLRKDWDKLVASAERAKETLIKDLSEGRRHRWRANVWRGFKEFLYEHIFFKNCAYCEAAIDAVYVGDAEHYRPKGEVTQRNTDGQEVVVVDPDGDPHPGYYWLAYDWRNVLPSCYKCNTFRGKGTQFPAIRHAFSPSQADSPTELDEFEEPFLLQPFRVGYVPKKFFVFDDLGGIEPRRGDKQAEVSIQVYDLKRGALRDRRLEAYKLAWDFFREAREHAIKNGRSLAGIMKEYEEGRKPHSAAALLYVGRMIAAEERANAQAMRRMSSNTSPSNRALVAPD
jgi:hypothetical protein